MSNTSSSSFSDYFEMQNATTHIENVIRAWTAVKKRNPIK